VALFPPVVSGEHWERIQLLFDELIELDTGRRRVRLELLSRTDPWLSDELRSLIDAHEGAGDFLNLLGTPPIDPTPTSEPVPLLKGTYTLLREIGAGHGTRISRTTLASIGTPRSSSSPATFAPIRGATPAFYPTRARRPRSITRTWQRSTRSGRRATAGSSLPWPTTARRRCASESPATGRRWQTR
jgi:hypothetical protein